MCFSRAELQEHWRFGVFRGHGDVAVNFCMSGIGGPVTEHIRFDSTMCSAVSVSVERLWVKQGNRCYSKFI